MSNSLSKISIVYPDDWHVHLRDGELLSSVLPFTTAQFARAIVMPNLTPPITSTSSAISYRERILKLLPEGKEFIPLMTCFLTDNSDPNDIELGFKEGVFVAVKLYPANATTNSDYGVSEWKNIFNVLSKMEKIKAGPETRMAPILHSTAEVIKKRGLIILISDLFDNQEEVLSGLQHFRYKGHEVIVFHIMDPQEMKLDFSQRTRFRDMESGEEIITDPLHIQKDYQREIEQFCNNYKIQCRQNNIDYVQLATDSSLDMALSEYLLKRKRMG